PADEAVEHGGGLARRGEAGEYRAAVGQPRPDQGAVELGEPGRREATRLPLRDPPLLVQPDEVVEELPGLRLGRQFEDRAGPPRLAQQPPGLLPAVRREPLEVA